MEKILNKVPLVIKKWLKDFLLRKGFSKSTGDLGVKFTKFYEDFRVQLKNDNSGIISLVFSKDRAMQLHAFLCSYFENVHNYSPMIILFKASNLDHQKSYKELERVFKEFPVTFIKETNFRSQLIEIINKTEEDKFAFYVDDMIFTQKFDYKALEKINSYTTIVALSRGCDMTFSIVLGKRLRLPVFTELSNGLLEFSWSNIAEYSDWSYPLGVSGYIFATKEILSILKSIPFQAPNSLESSMQVFLPLFRNRLGICTHNAISVCVHANLTQTEGNNPILGMFSLEELLEKWNAGYQINYQEFYNKPMNLTQCQNYTFSPSHSFGKVQS